MASNGIAPATSPSNSVAQNPAAGDPRIQTIIFFDIETTGIGGKDFHGLTRITEAAFIGILRNDFEELAGRHIERLRQGAQNGEPLLSDGSNAPANNFRDHLPRVLFKTRFGVRPNRPISNQAVTVSGLSDAHVEALPFFSTAHAQTVQAFFEMTPGPWCLVAHNGKAFDFKLLRSEMKKLGSHLPDGVFCLDSWAALRNLESLWEQQDREARIGIPISPMAKHITQTFGATASDHQNGLSAHDALALNQSAAAALSSPSKLERTGRMLPCPTSPSGEVPELIRVSIRATPTKQKVPLTGGKGSPVAAGESNGDVGMIINAESSSSKQPGAEAASSNGVATSSAEANGLDEKFTAIQEKLAALQAKRPPAYFKVAETDRPSNRLQHIYEQICLTGSQDHAALEFHTAEDDAVALMKICLQYGKDFLEVMDLKASCFNEIKPFCVDVEAKKQIYRRMCFGLSVLGFAIHCHHHTPYLLCILTAITMLLTFRQNFCLEKRQFSNSLRLLIASAWLWLWRIVILLPVYLLLWITWMLSRALILPVASIIARYQSANFVAALLFSTSLTIVAWCTRLDMIVTGKAVKYKTVEARAFFDITTFPQHPWVFASCHGKPLVFGNPVTAQFSHIFRAPLVAATRPRTRTVVNVFSAPVQSLKAYCIEAVRRLLHSSVSKAESLDLPKPLVDQLKVAFEQPSEFLLVESLVKSAIPFEGAAVLADA